MTQATRPLMEAENIVKHFPSRDGGGLVRAVDGVSLKLWPGETFGIVGESGSGKSTLARLLLHLIRPTSGTVRFQGEALADLDAAALRARRRDMQIVFQDPYASLDPRMPVGEIITESLAIHHLGNRARRRDKAVELLKLVGLEAEAASRYPHEFSGGQRQRIGIARAVALEPRLVILDEPVSALDVSIQSQILNLLMELKQRLGLSYIFISHDLSVVEHISDRVAVMYLGRVVEKGGAETLFDRPCHPYTEALISAIPGVGEAGGKGRIVLKGEPPNPENPPRGCHFHPRCPKALDSCRTNYPRERLVENVADRRTVSCHLY